jgi:parvulin-like peptidyl-prolyl isomerase
MKLQKKTFIIGISVIVALILAGGIWWWLSSSGKTSQTNQQFGYQALKINGKFVEQSVFTKEQNDFFRRYFRNAEMSRKSDEERNDLMLEEIINQKVVEEFLTSQPDITVSQKEIDGYIERYIKSRYPTPEEMQEYLNSVNCKSEAELQQIVKLYLLKTKTIPKIAAEYGVTVTDDEVAKEFELQKEESVQVGIKHILISFRVHPPEEAEKIANQVYKELQNGGNFEQLAKKYSDDAASKDSGGKLAPLNKAIVPDEYKKMLFNAKPGQIIPPFSTNDGYEITYIEKYVSYNHPLAELKDIMLTEKFSQDKQFQAWLTKIRSQMKIEILDPGFNAFRYSKSGKYKEAADLYLEIYSKKKQEAYFASALQNYQQAQNWDKVIELSRAALTQYDSKVPYYLFLAEGLYRKQQTAEAIKNLETAWTLAADSVVDQDMVFKAYDKFGLKRPGTGKINFPTPAK